MRIRLYGLVAMLCLHLATYSQVSLTNQLSVGDRLPSLFSGIVVQGKGLHQPFRISPGKALLIDFFATWCSSCVKALPHLKALAAEMPNQLIIAVVSSQPEATVKAFLAKHPELKDGELVFVAQDSLLTERFPHRLLPHEVWIEASGRVAAITGAEAVTKENLLNLLAGHPLALPIKRDIVGFTAARSLLSYDTGYAKQAILYGSFFSRSLEGAASGSGFFADSIQRKFYQVNSRIEHLYEQAYDLKPSYTLVPHPAIDIVPETLYCYELVMPATASWDAMRLRMQADLQTFFGWTAEAVRSANRRGAGSTDTLWLRPNSITVHSKLP